jgi:hypothetical protein
MINIVLMPRSKLITKTLKIMRTVDGKARMLQLRSCQVPSIAAGPTTRVFNR